MEVDTSFAAKWNTIKNIVIPKLKAYPQKWSYYIKINFKVKSPWIRSASTFFGGNFYLKLYIMHYKQINTVIFISNKLSIPCTEKVVRNKSHFYIAPVQNWRSMCLLDLYCLRNFAPLSEANVYDMTVLLNIKWVPVHFLQLF